MSYLRGALQRFGALLTIVGRDAEAESIYRQAIEKGSDDPFIPLIVSDLGSVLTRQGRYDEAQFAYKKAIELDPSDPDAYKKLVSLLRFEESNKQEESLPFLEKLIEISSDDFTCYLAICSITKQLGKVISVNYVEKARQLISEDDYYNRACLESICDNLNLAFDYLRKAIQLEKFNPGWAWKDPDLEWLRNDPRFIEIVGPKPEK